MLLDAAYKWCDDNGIALSTRYIPNFTPQDVMHWQKGFLRAKYEFDRLNPSYVADGCPLLTITYVLTTCYNTFTKEEVDQVYNGMLAMAKQYDCIYYLPYGVLPIVDDGRRTTNANYHRMQDLVLHGLFDLHQDDLTIVELYETDLQKRIDLVMLDMPKENNLLDLLK